MARYANIDEVLHNVPVDDMGNVDFITLEKVLMKSTADVVPKSEVDKLHEVIFKKRGLNAKTAKERNQYSDEVDRLERICNSYALQYGTVKDQQAVIDEAKAEVAMEIFEEIESLLREHSDYEILCDGKSLWYYEESLGEDIAELKKKYTEGGKSK